MKMYKRIFGVLLCLCMLLGAVSLANAEEDGATGSGAETEGNTGHSHELCAGLGDNCTDPAHSEGNHGDEVTFATKLYQGEDGKLYIGEDEWEYDRGWGGYMLGAGTYYLSTDLTLDHGIQIRDSNGGSVVLCLNGKTISCTTGKTIQIQSVVNKDLTFTLCDCESKGMITHTENSGNSSGVDVAYSNNEDNTDVAKFIMYNGCITQNKGSGVNLNVRTSFTMYGGSITGNGHNNTSGWDVYGGGVCVNSEVAFAMYGGTITENYGDYGGGVSVAGASGKYKAGNFTMYGGSITKNHAGKIGGGIYSTSDNISIYGGSVTDNSVTKTGKAGGIYVPSSGTLTVGGNVNISGNWKGDSEANGSKNNVYLDYYEDDFATIVIEKPLTGTGSIGITTKTSVATTPNASVKIAAGKDKYVLTDADKDHFTPDTGYCKVEKKDDGIYLTHVHSGSTATCMAKAKCDGCNAFYGEKNPNNHTGTLGEWKTDNTNHWKEYSCCKTKVDVTEHTYNQEAVNPIYLKTEATCKQYSVYYKSCICGAKGTETFGYESGGYASHVYDDTTWGYKDRDGHAHLCKTEGCNEHDTIVAHTGGTATCKNRAVCTSCNQEYGKLDTDNHTGSLSTDWRGKDDNKHWQVWSCCGAQDRNEVEAHNGTKWTVGEVTTSATCTTTGVRTYTCEDCGYTKTETIPANGHDFENGTYVYDDTQHWKKCAKCDAEDTDHKTNHTEVIDKAKPATTTETGLTEGKHCDVCGKVLVAQEVTPKLTLRYYYNSTTTTTKDTTKKDNTKSPGTFDPGVGVYALTAVLSVTGMAWVGRKKH